MPEITPTQQFKLNEQPKVLREFRVAKENNIHTVPVLIGPITYILLSNVIDNNTPVNLTQNVFTKLVSNIIPVYKTVVKQLINAGATSIRFDEPHLVTDLPTYVAQVYKQAYTDILADASGDGKVNFMVATYFGELQENLDLLLSTPHIQTVHIDITRDAAVLSNAVKLLIEPQYQHIDLSIGCVDGRNIWKSNLSDKLSTIQSAIDVLGKHRIIVATSCSLLHTPHSLQSESKLDGTIKSWLAFAVEKADELRILTVALNAGVKDSRIADAFQLNTACIGSRASSELIHKPDVQQAIHNVKLSSYSRASSFSERKGKQAAALKLPLFPTTTIGSFPQTSHVRSLRAKLKSGKMNVSDYNTEIENEIKKCVDIQMQLGIDVLVHGEFERNDMVEYFGELIDGYVFTQYGWVQSYGSRCVKPPIIYADLHRPAPMTVRWSKFAATLTDKPMKAMLTGPITMLQWSFVRDDQPRAATARQLALCIRSEVRDLEAAGLSVIQVDEPAIREGLPLRKSAWDKYLRWSVDCFRLSTSCVGDTTQIHTHMCYSDFQDIISSILLLDADVTTIENARSDLKLLSAFSKFEYSNEIGPGLYDIHSANVPTVQSMYERATQLLQYFRVDQLWLNPDCGLKTRKWPETIAALKNMCKLADQLRKQHAT